MNCTLLGVKRGTFTGTDGKEIKFGHLFVAYDFDSIDDDSAGLEASKIRFDYDGVSELLSDPNISFPCSADIQFNARGKCIRVLLSSD